MKSEKEEWNEGVKQKEKQRETLQQRLKETKRKIETDTGKREN